MNPGAILWVGAAFAGFLVWWPIGVAFLVTIFATAVSQQLTGYRHQEPQRGSIHIGEASRQETLRQIEADQAEIRLIANRLRNAKTQAEFDRIMSSQKRLGGY
jgi:Protein of unknown function (DUF2852).